MLTSFSFRGNHEVMILDAREDRLEVKSLAKLRGLGNGVFVWCGHYLPDWDSANPEVTHWEFFERTVKWHFETDTHIFVHACLDPELDDMNDQRPDWLLYLAVRILRSAAAAQKWQEKAICGHTPQRSGNIKDVGFGACIDTGPAIGGWLSCL